MRYSTYKLRIPVCLTLLLLLGVIVNAQTQQPLFREYRGVRLGMTAAETRAKLGEPAFKSDDQDLYAFRAEETAQIVYNAEHKVVTISVDYTGGNGAPDYRTVVGTGLLLQRPDGSLFRVVHYDAERLWVSFNKSAAVVPVVTVTIQAIR
jgi:hypothetical protein